EQLLFGAEVPPHQRDVHPGLRRDLAEPGASKPLAQKQLARGVQEAAPGRRGIAASPPLLVAEVVVIVGRLLHAAPLASYVHACRHHARSLLDNIMSTVADFVVAGPGARTPVRGTRVVTLILTAVLSPAAKQ